MIAVTIQRIDASSLNRAIEMAMGVTTQEPRNLVINAGRGIALKAKALTPFVTQTAIDVQLGVISTPILSTRGKRKGLPLKSGRQKVEVPDQSVAMKIVLARLWTGSRFNQLTHQRWALDRATFSPGGGKRGFWAKVKSVATRMVKARHSSTHFLQAGWASAYKKLTQLRYGGGLVQDDVIDVESEVVKGELNDFGYATLSGTVAEVSLLLENAVGMKGVNAESYNTALMKYGTWPLQAAVNQQAGEMQSHYLPRWEAALARRWNAIP